MRRDLEDSPERTAAARAAAALWCDRPERVQLVNDGFNLVFRFEDRGEGRYLRVRHADERSRSRLASATDYLLHLFRSGVPVCEPVRSSAGRLVEEVVWGAGAVDGTTMLATVVKEVPGQPIGVVPKERRVVEAWGRALGGLHRAAERYVPGPGLGFPTWRDVRAWVVQAMPSDDPAVRAAHDEAVSRLEDLPRSADVLGLTHADFRPGNVIWDGARAWTVDFDEPVYDWYVADIARALLESADRPPETRRLLRAWFIAGYRSARPLDDRWLDALPWFERLKAIDLYLWVLHDNPGSELPAGTTRSDWLATWRGRILAARTE